MHFHWVCSNVEEKIIGGTNTNIASVPYMVSKILISNGEREHKIHVNIHFNFTAHYRKKKNIFFFIFSYHLG